MIFFNELTLLKTCDNIKVTTGYVFGGFMVNIYKWISKKKKISEHIDKIEFNIGLFIVSIWIVKRGEHYFLIDAGMWKMAQYVIENYIEEEKRDKIKAILLTHGHSDHSGGVQQVHKLYPHLPVIVENIEIQYLTGAACYPRRKKPEKLVFSEEIFLPLQNEVAKQILVDSGLIAVFSPGHSPGHTCFYHKQDNVLLAGDLFTTNKEGVLQPPMKSFTANMEQALQTGKEILMQYPECLLSVTHGSEVESPLVKMKDTTWYKEEV